MLTQCNYKGRRLPVWEPWGHGAEGLLPTTADLLSLHTHTKYILLGVTGRAAVHSDTHSGHRTRPEPTLRRVEVAGNGPAGPAVVTQQQTYSLEAGVPVLSSYSDPQSSQWITGRLFPLSNSCSREEVKII